MNSLETHTKEYLEYCHIQKRLDPKTLKAYRIDLAQFISRISPSAAADITPAILECFIGELHQSYKPKTVKRKIASVRAFFRYLEYRELIDQNPFNKVQIKFREPVILPKTIPLYAIEDILNAIYAQYRSASTDYQRRSALRDAAVIELLFSTGIRISELCSLRSADVNLSDRTILIYGKGAKERRIQIGNDDVAKTLETYRQSFLPEIQNSRHFFVNLSGRALSDQSVRRMINKYSLRASTDLHITPHMFRHTFATSLLEADVDIRYIQEMLGHSSINVTEIYTHVAMTKQREILTTRHPRKDFHLHGQI